MLAARSVVVYRLTKSTDYSIRLFDLLDQYQLTLQKVMVVITLKRMFDFAETLRDPLKRRLNILLLQ